MSERQRALRTLMQFVFAGGLVAILDELAKLVTGTSLGPLLMVCLTAVNVYAVSYAQNWLEERGVIPAVLKGGSAQDAEPEYEWAYYGYDPDEED